MKDKVTVTTIRKMKSEGDKITALALYDHAFAALADQAGVDIALVGDSLGMTFQGEENTLKVTMDHMAYHTRAVGKGLQRALLVADMPFMSFRLGIERTLENAGRLVAEGAEAVKLEGVESIIGSIRELVAAGIPVMGHLGLTPQSVHALGGFKVQGKEPDAAKRLVEDACRLQDAGVFSLVLECVPMEVGAKVTSQVQIPVIGIGAGPYCDGQVLVANDMLGLSPTRKPKFVKEYTDLAAVAQAAFGEFAREVRSGAFPDQEHSYTTPMRRLKAL
ncbi:MAG: 3-methyl-2-oxobutanoate hydroxymethyltransferase [Nitrospinota bacterium]|nr:3-methyl-2-oxobutanoate hydroxymethyltransferase [Nitrospinota bacterium]MDH5677150.1 3-methyl-2-oxobutanoate hydroxymethyltransferase [Nitrospinota bacterium]MDH5757533.1 3-methyl-2-oxobutanoate hydroxymethyltransferase [Nitrospinota bacterium]